MCLEGKGVGGCRVTVRELEKGGMKERGVEGRGEGEGGMAGGVLNLPPSLSPCCPPTPPPSRLSEAGDRRRVGFCVCVFEGGGERGCLHCLACGCQRSGTWSRPPRATHTHTELFHLPPVTYTAEQTRPSASTS